MELIEDSLLRVKNEIFPSNTYLLRIKGGKECLIIDPGLDHKAITETLHEYKLIPRAILCTHGHFDHIGSASYFKEKYKIPYYLHEADFKMSQSANFFLKLAGITHKINTPIPDFYFRGFHEKILIDGFALNVYNFPGHSKGSCVINYENFLFTGDTIYKKGLGLDGMPKEDKSLLRQSILEMFNLFNDHDLVLPGHGSSATLGSIKDNNDDLQKFLKT